MTPLVIFGKSFDLDAMSGDQLDDIAGQLRREIERLEHQVDLGHARFRAAGHPLDGGLDEAPVWFKKLCLAMDRHRAALISVNAAIEGRQASARLADAFMDVCRERMQPELYARAKAIAEKRLERASVVA